MMLSRRPGFVLAVVTRVTFRICGGSRSKWRGWFHGSRSNRHGAGRALALEDLAKSEERGELIGREQELAVLDLVLGGLASGQVRSLWRSC